MVPSAVICHAGADLEFARTLGDFLSLNCNVELSYEEARLDGQHDFIDTVEDALAVDHPILLLSPNSVPAPWQRARWERVLVDEARRFKTQIAYVVLAPCKYPEVLQRRGAFFDLSHGQLAVRRALKHWLLRQTRFFQGVVELPVDRASAQANSADVDRLASKLADQPGMQTAVPRDLALTFARTHLDDFGGALWFNCAHRSRAGILGDIARALGLTLKGTLEQNAISLKEFCASRRLLLVFEGVAPTDEEFLTVAGRVSTLFAAGHPRPVQRSLEETAVLFSSWRTNFDACLSALGDAQSQVCNLAEYSGERWEAALSLASSAYSCLRHAGRLSEAYEFLGWITEALRARGDLLTAARWEWEKSWILEEWGEPASPRIGPPGNRPVQLDLELDI